MTKNTIIKNDSENVVESENNNMDTAGLAI